MERKALIERIKANPREENNEKIVYSTVEERQMTFNNRPQTTY